MRRVVLGGLLLFCVAAAPTTPAQAPPRMAPPALELRRVLNFLLESDALPETSERLGDLIAAGLRKRLVFPPNAIPVMVAGGQFPRLDRLSIDFTNASIDSDRRVIRLRPLGPPVQMIHAQAFDLTADPVNIDGAAMRLRIRANDVRLGVSRDRFKNPILVFRDARDGEVQLQTTAGDLSRILHDSANFRGKKYGLNVQRAILRLSSPNERQLNAELRLISTLLLLPVQIQMTARVDVDDQGMATISNLTCDGSDLAGWLISGMIRPALARYNGKTMPLVSFPSDTIKIRDVRVWVQGDHVRVGATFGSEVVVTGL